MKHVQTGLMLVQSGAGNAFVPGALAPIKIDGSYPVRERITVHAAWRRRADLSRNSCASYTAIMTAV